MLSPTVLHATMLGAGLFTGVMALIGIGLWMSEQTTHRPQPPHAAPPEDLNRVVEVSLADPFPKDIHPQTAKVKLRELAEQIRNENNVKQDAFLLAHLNRRTELRGLPFVMGDACRMPADQSTSFQNSVQAVRNGLEADSGRRSRSNEIPDGEHTAFWNSYFRETNGQGTRNAPGIAALTQILAPERMPMRAGLVQRLSQSDRPEATRALARAAIFDPAGEVQGAARRALKDRPPEQYTDVLMHGLRYPMGIVAERAGVAMIVLDRKDMLPMLANFLSEPPPGDPVPTTVNEKKVCVVREMVRINHHRNCLLCHPPSNTGNDDEVPGVIPSPGTPFPESPRDAYGSARFSGDAMVRADTTYLRQDFSMMMPVANAAPWPEMQRFDFLVRSRVVEGKELDALQQRVKQRPADRLSPNHVAALRVLRQLTGRDAAPTREAWQQVLAQK
jgi:hypothetical protein